MKNLFFILSVLFSLNLGAQSLDTYTKDAVCSQFTFRFDDPEWRGNMGHAQIFDRKDGSEMRFFPYGVAIKDVKAKIREIETGPYAESDHWVNFMMLMGSSETEDYIKITPGKGLLIWLHADAFVTHEKEYDTKAHFHLLFYLPDYPGTKGLVGYYMEDYKSSGNAEVFRLDGEELTLREEGGKLFLEARMSYDPAFGGSDLSIQLTINGVMDLKLLH